MSRILGAGVNQGCIFGNGSGTTVIAAPTTLSADAYYGNLTLQDELQTNGFRVFVNGKLKFDGGKITCNGESATDKTGGAGAASVFPFGKYGTMSGGGSGGDGGDVGDPAGHAGVGKSYSLGGNGGNGGISGGSGGADGVVTAPEDKYGGLNVAKNFAVMLSGKCWAGDSDTPQTLKGGGGGGGGGAGEDDENGGGGGGAGGIILVVAREVEISTGMTGIVEAKGGDGYNAVDAGGGGGGGGGAVVIFTNAVSGPGSWAIDVSGGAKGNSAPECEDGVDGNSFLVIGS